MNFFKKALAFVLCIGMIATSMSVASLANTAQLGTKDNPENANDKYFSAAKCYLLNTDLQKGDSDGYWYTFTVPSAGIICIDATARDAAGKETDAFQVTVECNDKTYYAFDDAFTRPIAPFRLSKNDVVKVHMIAKPDKNGVYPQLKIYCNIVTVYGTESDPLYVKSDNGFVANVQAKKQITYQDGTNGGMYGGKGIVVSSHNKAVIYSTEVIVNGTVYTDKDKDGTIELMLPGDPNAQIALHPTFSIYNDNSKDVSYVIKVVNSASEGAEVTHTHSFKYSSTAAEPTLWDEGTEIHECACGETKNVSLPTIERWKKGDVNNDGSLNTIDANMVKRAIVGFVMDEQAVDAADIDDDRTVNAQDSYLLKKIIIGVK